MEKSESFRIAPNRRFWPIKYRREPFRCGSAYAKEPHNAQATASMPAEEPIEKLELPLADDAEIHRLVNQFEQCTLPYKHWTHRAHLAVATLYLQQFSFDDALTRIRKTIRS